MNTKKVNTEMIEKATNYHEIKESLELILRDKVSIEKKQEILKELDDAVGNNWENLEVKEIKS